MKPLKYFILAILILTFAGCSVQPVHRGEPDARDRGYGPPPHAPAHGYRHKHQQGVELRFDSGLGVYVVIEIPDMYFNDGLYIRWSDRGGYWAVSPHYRGPWRIAAPNEIPKKLDQRKGKWKGKGKGKGKGLYK